jgi:hypothetical protein
MHILTMLDDALLTQSGANAAIAGANQDSHIQQGSSSNGTCKTQPDVVGYRLIDHIVSTVRQANNVFVTQAIPRLSTMFTGRKHILEQLARFLDPSKPSMSFKRQRIFVLYGLGGAGKTQIMIKFVIEFGDQYDPFHQTFCRSH